MLIEKIKNDRDIARKSGNSSEVYVLGTLIGEIETAVIRGNVKSDSDVVAIVKKFIDGVEETLEYSVPADVESVEKLHAEMEIYLRYVPKQMTNAEIEMAVNACISSNPDFKLGQVMAYMKKHFAGTYDGKIASEIAKEMM